MSESVNEQVPAETDKQRKYRYKAGAFLVGVAGISAAVGFGRTLATAKKTDPSFFSKGMTGSIEMADTGANLAMRALGWGTVIAVLGTGSLCFAIWKLSGAKDMNEFRMKCGSILPRIPKNEVPNSRTEFEGLSDLMTYLSTWKGGK